MKRSKKSGSGFFSRRRPDEATRDPRPRPYERGPAPGESLVPARPSFAEVLDHVRHSEEKTAAVLAKPMGDLAKAFAMQAEMLKSIHDTQVKLQQTMEDDSRTDVVVNSTNALNDTFRGVRTVQQSLIDRLERAEGAGRGWRWAAAFGIVLAVGGAVWGVNWLVHAKDESARALDERMREIETGVIPDQNKLLTDALADRDSLRQEAEKRAAEAQSQRERLESLALEKESDALAARLRTENDALKNRSTEKEKALDEAQKRVAKLDGEVREGLAKLETAHVEIDRLHTEVLDRLKSGERFSGDAVENAGRERPIVDPEPSRQAAETATAKPDASNGAASGNASAKEKAASDVTGVDLKEASKEEARVRALTLVNKLLEKQRSNHTYRVDTLGRVAKEGWLEDVVVTESVPGRGIVKNITAKRLLINVSPQGDIVDFNFEEGAVESLMANGRLGNPAAFYNQKYRLSILCLNGDDWLRQREAYITAK